MVKISFTIRLPKEDKNYWLGQLQRFANGLDSKKILVVQFGKQDIRGAESITIIDHHHRVPKQLHFSNKWEMLGYIKGYNEASGEAYYNPFQAFKNKD